MARVGKQVSALLSAVFMALMVFSLAGAQTAYADEKDIAGLYLNLDLKTIDLNAKLPEGQLRARANGALSLGDQSEGVAIVGFEDLDKYSWEESQWSNVPEDSTDAVSPGPTYYAVYRVKPLDGYAWSSDVASLNYKTRVDPSWGFRLFLNDARCTNAYLFCDADSTLVVWLPIGYNISYDAAELSQNAFTYNGTAQIPQVKSVTLGKGLMLESNYYDVAYTDKNGNEVTPINAGQYFARISAKGAIDEFPLITMAQSTCRSR